MKTNQEIFLNLSANLDKKNLLKIRNWKKENQKAIDSYNQRIKQSGLFSDGLREF